MTNKWEKYIPGTKSEVQDEEFVVKVDFEELLPELPENFRWRVFIQDECLKIHLQQRIVVEKYVTFFGRIADGSDTWKTISYVPNKVSGVEALYNFLSGNSQRDVWIISRNAREVLEQRRKSMALNRLNKNLYEGNG